MGKKYGEQGFIFYLIDRKTKLEEKVTKNFNLKDIVLVINPFYGLIVIFCFDTIAI